MAPRNRASNKKKPVAAATSSKPKPKKKDSVVVNPLAKLDDKSVVASIAILGERRDNAVRILNKECPTFDLANRMPKLLKDYPGYSVCISGGSPELSLDAKSSKPNLIVILVPNSKLPPPFVAYSIKNELIIQELSKHQLSWHQVAPRVFLLKSDKRMTKAAIKALSDDSLAMEEHLQLWTIVPSVKLQCKADGKLDIRAANFQVINNKGEPIYGFYEKGAGLQDFIDAFVDDYGNELGGDPETQVKDAIRQAFAVARSELEDQVELLDEEGFDEDLLESIKTVKIYPKGTNDAEKSPYINEYYGRAHKVL